MVGTRMWGRGAENKIQNLYSFLFVYRCLVCPLSVKSPKWPVFFCLCVCVGGGAGAGGGEVAPSVCGGRALGEGLGRRSRSSII